jgi:hypothetical protein
VEGGGRKAGFVVGVGGDVMAAVRQKGSSFIVAVVVAVGEAREECIISGPLHKHIITHESHDDGVTPRFLTHGLAHPPDGADVTAAARATQR